jgi:hypothetical protein
MRFKRYSLKYDGKGEVATKFTDMLQHLLVKNGNNPKMARLVIMMEKRCKCARSRNNPEEAKTYLLLQLLDS